MPLITLPALAWGPADDLSASPYSGAAGVTSGFTDPFGTGFGYELNDTSGAAFQGKSRTIAFGADGAQTIVTLARASTATGSLVEVTDQTLTANRGRIDLTWTGATLTSVTPSNGAVVIGFAPSGGGWYTILWQIAGVLKASTNAIAYYPAGPAATAQGKTIFCVRNIVLLDLFDEAVSWEEDREGSEYQQGPSGFEDAARVGIDHYLEGRVRYIPQSPRAEGPVSGWYGENEAAGVNCGIKAMLRAGREKQLLRWIPDRSNSAAGQDAYLVDPMRDKPGFERNWDRTFTMRLRSASVFAGV